MSAELLEELIAAGTPARLVAMVAVLAAKAEQLDRRRATDAARQRTHYGNRQATSRDLTADNATHVSHVSHVDPPMVSSPTPLSSFHPESSKPKRVSRSTGKTLPSDWTLSEQGQAFARSKGWEESRISSEAQRFKDHAIAGDRRQANWEAAWRNWVTSPYQTRSAVNGQRSHGSGNGRRGADFFAGLAEVAADIARDSGVAGDSDPEIPLGRFNIDG